MTAALLLGTDLRRQLEQAARDAFPRECCGLIEGRRDGARIEALALHPARNLAVEADRFEIDPAEQFRLLHAARGRRNEIVGCYHSHPGGRPEPSARDRDGAGEIGFVWLIAAVGVERVRIAGFAFQPPGFQRIVLA